MAFSLQARVVFPVERPAIEHGVVAVDHERIIAVGGAEAAIGEVCDLGNVALLPGLVNAHTHLEFSKLPQPLGAVGIRLVDWIRLVIAERGRREDSAPLAIETGMHECLGCGVTSIGDIATVDVPANRFHPLDLTLFAEVIGFSLARAESALDALHARLLMLKKSESHGGGGIAGVHLGISPHAPYTVSPDLLGRLIGLARDRRLPVAMHLAESEDELKLLEFGSGPFQELLDERSMWDPSAIPHGSRPLDYLRMLADAPRSLVIHGNYLDQAERAYLAAHSDRMSLVYCPRTHDYFQHPPYPLAELLAAGVRVALGTDSRASNPDLNLLAEMQHVARMFPALDPHDVLRMGTLMGAQTLGVAGHAGSIVPGKLANFVAIALPGDESGSRRDMLAALLASESEPCAVWLRGKKLKSPSCLT
jgi:aminodeoxyfutalosine deaminase